MGRRTPYDGMLYAVWHAPLNEGSDVLCGRGVVLATHQRPRAIHDAYRAARPPRCPTDGPARRGRPQGAVRHSAFMFRPSRGLEAGLMPRFNVTMPQDLWDRLGAEADRVADGNRSFVLRRALETALGRSRAGATPDPSPVGTAAPPRTPDPPDPPNETPIPKIAKWRNR